MSRVSKTLLSILLPLVIFMIMWWAFVYGPMQPVIIKNAYDKGYRDGLSEVHKKVVIDSVLFHFEDIR
jgi:hypothetical protein